MGKRVEVVKGERYHDWTAIREVGRNDHGKRMAECVCKCGAIQPVIIYNLTSGRSKRCKGCMGKLYQVEVKIGQRFGHWVVLCEIKGLRDNRGEAVRRFRCKCDCGSIKNKSPSELRSGKNKQCVKCNSKQRREENLKKYRIGKGLDPDTPIGEQDGRERRMFADTVRTKIFARDNGKCQLCFKRAKQIHHIIPWNDCYKPCLLYTSPSPRDRTRSRMPSSA